MQMCDAEDVKILKGVVSEDHIHMHIEYPSRVSISDLVKRLKGRTFRILQREFTTLKKRYGGRLGNVFEPIFRAVIFSPGTNRAINFRCPV